MTDRRRLLESAADIIDGPRNVLYGNPTDDFKRTASYWSTHLGGVVRRAIHERAPYVEQLPVEEFLEIIDSLLSPHDVAIMMMQLKHSRLAWSPQVEDHWKDAAGYAACGYECVVQEGDSAYV